MEIGLDGRLWGASTGIGQYTSCLLAGLSKIVPAEMNVTLVVARNRAHFAYPSGVRVTSVPLAHRFVWANLCVPLVTYREHFDLYHAVDNLSLPLFWPKGKTRYVLTIHDLIPLVFPNGVRARHRHYFRFAIRRLLRIADAIIVDSESTKSSMLERFSVPEEKLNVVYLGVDRFRFQPVNDQERIREVCQRYGIGENPYILFVGNIEPRKNLSSLIHAYAKLVKSRKCQHQIRLVIAGSVGHVVGDVLSLPSRCGVGDQVILPGIIRDDDLPALYSGASLFVFPSYYEGFGFPVLEAMSCGVPVVASNASSLPEIAGDAALLVDPHRQDDLCQAMQRVLTDEGLRQEMKQKGFARVELYSWEKTAQRTLQVYKKVCGVASEPSN